jgi:putative Holliday junction resolvase
MRVLGIDYGRKRIGLALSDATGMLARAWKTIAHEGGAAQVAATIAAELATLDSDGEEVGAVVLGLPRRLSGDANEQTAEVEALAGRLRARLSIPVVLQDERLTSREAESRLAMREKDWRKRKLAIDAEAAAIILQDYLDSAPRSPRAGSGDDALRAGPPADGEVS